MSSAATPRIERRGLHMNRAVRRAGQRRLALGLAVVLSGGLIVALTNAGAAASTQVVKSVAKGTDGKAYWVTNHLVTSNRAAAAAVADEPTGHHSYLLVWAGDANIGDTKGSDIQGTHLA